MFVCLWVYPFKGGGLGTLLKGKLQTVRPTIKMFVHVHYMNDFLLRHKNIFKKKKKKKEEKKPGHPSTLRMFAHVFLASVPSPAGNS